MKDENKILAIIPARSGSKSIIHKNIRSIAGKPLIAWTIIQALESKLINRVIVSTDSKEYADIAKSYGAEVPFLRPSEFAKDESTDMEVFKHALDWLNINENYQPEYCVHLRPTCPIRRKGLIDDVIKQLLANPHVDSVRTVIEAPHTPYKMWNIEENSILKPLLNCPGIKEPYSQPRQYLPKAFLQTASVDVMKSNVITEFHSMTGKTIMGFVEDSFFDIDSIEELESAMHVLANGNFETAARNNETICFDIDGVIATLTPDNQYENATCNNDIASLITELKSLGFKIVLYTARGSQTGIDWKKITEDQMKSWGINYDELRFGKPAALYYIDDRSITLGNLRKMTTNLKNKNHGNTI